jgi:hypothetical protein
MKLSILILIIFLSACTKITPEGCNATPDAEINNNAETIENKIIPKAKIVCNF